MAAWAKDQKTSGKLRLLADPSAALAKAMDLTVDIAPLGGVSYTYYAVSFSFNNFILRSEARDIQWLLKMVK